MKKIRPDIIIIAALTAISALLHILFIASTSFADFFNNTIARFFRFLLAKIADIFPFSIAEILLFLVPVFVIILIVHINKKGGSVLSRIASASKLILCVALGIYILFVATFASGYSCSGLEKRLDISKENVSTTELYETLVYVTDKVNVAAKNIDFEDDGSSELPYDTDELSSIICRSYEVVFSSYKIGESFSSRVKPLNISPVMTYTHISGVYSFFTGEANLNTNYPDYVCAFSAAHELAHQRGIARENEANFMAYLVCIESDNEYLQYAGYLSMFSYLSSALRSADYELYAKAVSPLCKEARGELNAYSIFFDKYRDSTASKVSDAVNDTYLKVQGTEGVKSYGMVVDLAVAYHRNDT